MASFLNLIARLLIVSLWIYCGVNKFQELGKSSEVAIKGITDFDNWLVKDIQVGPMPFKDLMLENAQSLVCAIGAIEIIASLLVLAGSKLGAFLLVVLTVLMTSMQHNIFYSHFTKDEKILHARQAYSNFLILGSLIMVMGYSGKEVAESKYPIIFIA